MWGDVVGRADWNPRGLGPGVLISHTETTVTTRLRDSCGSQMNCKKLCVPILFVFLFHLETAVLFIRKWPLSGKRSRTFQGLQTWRVLDWRGVIEAATRSCWDLQRLWGVKQCSHGKGLSETKWRPGLFHLPQRPLSPTAACQQQMCLVDMCFAANKKQ